VGAVVARSLACLLACSENNFIIIIQVNIGTAIISSPLRKRNVSKLLKNLLARFENAAKILFKQINCHDYYRIIKNIVPGAETKTCSITGCVRI
jgi:hypothetical protein